MAYLKGGQILIDISYLPIPDEQDQILSIDLLREREHNQIKSLFHDSILINKNQKPVRLKLTFAGYSFEINSTSFSDDYSEIYFNFIHGHIYLINVSIGDENIVVTKNELVTE